MFSLPVLLKATTSVISSLLTWMKKASKQDLLLVHCIQVDSSIVLYWISPSVILGVLGKFCHFYSIFGGKILLPNSVDPDQMPHYVASDLCLHCLPMTLLRVSW